MPAVSTDGDHRGTAARVEFAQEGAPPCSD